MRKATVQDALRIAAAMRQLREVEMEDARRLSEMRDRCSDVHAKAYLQGQVEQLVATARKWNRQLVRAQREIRQLLYHAHFCRSLKPAQIAGREAL